MGQITLTVYFDDPYWVGLVEQCNEGELRVARHIFGSEPLPGQVHEFVLYGLARLLYQSAAQLSEVIPAPSRRNPKRVAREAARATEERGISPEAEAALRQQREQAKRERRRDQRDQRDRLNAERRQRAAERAKARHRGR